MSSVTRLEKKCPKCTSPLEQVTLPIQQRLKFLDALLVFRYYQTVLFFRFSKQVRRTIVILYAIVVMNQPSFGQWLAIRFLPNKNMLPDIWFFVCCTRMCRGVNKDIAIAIKFSTLPLGVFFSTAKRFKTRSTTTPAIFPITTHTSQRHRTYQLATIYTRMLSFGNPIYTGLLTPSLSFLIAQPYHSSILSHFYNNVN